MYLVNCVCENIYKGYDDLRLKEKDGIIKVVEGLPNLLRVFREGLA